MEKTILKISFEESLSDSSIKQIHNILKDSLGFHTEIEELEVNKLIEYKKAYQYLLEYWESFEKEQKEQINKDLNKIFVLNKGEQVKD